MAWTTIPNSNLEPGAPIRSVDGQALRDNAIAIADGDAGAPRVSSNAAITWGGGGTGMTGTTNARNWILDRIADASAGPVGTYAFTSFANDSGLTFGETRPGSRLTPGAVTDTGVDVAGSTLNGTWRCMGGSSESGGGSDIARATLWLRIS